MVFREIADDDAKIGKKNETRARKDEKFACLCGWLLQIEESMQAGAHIGVDASERRSEQEAVDNKLLEQKIPFVVGTYFMHIRKDQVAPRSRRGGSCARPKLLRTTIPGICADMHKASPYSKPSILGDMNTPKKLLCLRNL